MKGRAIVITLAVVLLSAAPVWAASVLIGISGAPTQAMQGETKGFSINVAANGGMNLQHIPATVTVDTSYTAGGGSGDPDGTSVFSAPDDPYGIPPCEWQNKSTPLCKASQSVTGGPFTIPATVAVPADLPPGIYIIFIVAAAGNGLELPGTMPSFTLEVLPASSAPSVSILAPANGDSFLVGTPLTAQVEVSSDLPLLNVSGELNGVSLPLDLDAGEGYYEAALTLDQPGQNTFIATAVNAMGSGSDTSTFAVHYAFSSWLPPITTAKFQSGRTLPVKFRIGDFNGLTDQAVAQVYVDGEYQGQAYVLYDDNGPYYQLEIRLGMAGPCTIKVTLDDGVTEGNKTITVK